MNRFQSLILTASTAIFGLSIAICSHAYSQQQTILNLALGIEVSDRQTIAVLPKITEKAEITDNQQEAIAYYNLAINTANTLDRTSLSETEKQQLDRVLKIATDAKKQIATKQLTTLKRQLKSQQIGEIKALIAGEFENQYTPGAIQTTYKLLMRPSGLHADANNDGFISSQKEIDRIPCQTLIDIEKLWRKYTDNRCGWFGSDSKYISDRCQELSITEFNNLTDKKYQVNHTLLSTIFKTEDFYFIEAKLDRCFKENLTN